MNDYISREVALEALCADCCAKECNKELCQDWHNLSVVPAADVRPVVRGRWEEVGGEDEGWQFYRCANCGAVGIPQYHYCPNCGADMRGDSDV